MVEVRLDVIFPNEEQLRVVKYAQSKYQAEYIILVVKVVQEVVNVLLAPDVSLSFIAECLQDTAVLADIGEQKED